MAKHVWAIKTNKKSKKEKKNVLCVKHLNEYCTLHIHTEFQNKDIKWHLFSLYQCPNSVEYGKSELPNPASHLGLFILLRGISSKKWNKNSLENVFMKHYAPNW